MKHQTVHRITFAFLLLLISCKFGFGQNFNKIRPSAILTDPLTNSEIKYKKMVKRLGNTTVEIREHDSLNRLVFWYRRTQPERLPKVRSTIYTYNSQGKLHKQYFIEKDTNVIWEYKYDTLSMKTLVYKYNLANIITPPIQEQWKKDVKALESGRTNYSELLKTLVSFINAFELNTDSLRPYLFLEVSYNKQQHEIQKLQFSEQGDTVLKIFTEYNKFNRIESINYLVKNKSTYEYKFIYNDTGKSSGKLLRMEQWNYFDGDKEQPLSFASFNFTYYDNGQINQTYEVFMGIVISYEQYKYQEDGKQESLLSIYLNNGNKFETLSIYHYDKLGALVKCIVSDASKKVKKKVYKYEYQY